MKMEVNMKVINWTDKDMVLVKCCTKMDQFMKENGRRIKDMVMYFKLFDMVMFMLDYFKMILCTENELY